MGIEFFFLFAIVAFLGEFTRQEIQIFVSLARSIDPIHCLKCEIMRSWHTNAIVCAYASACVYFICTWNYNIVSNPNIYMLVYWNIVFFLLSTWSGFTSIIPRSFRYLDVLLVWEWCGVCHICDEHTFFPLQWEKLSENMMTRPIFINIAHILPGTTESYIHQKWFRWKDNFPSANIQCAPDISQYRWHNKKEKSNVCSYIWALNYCNLCKKMHFRKGIWFAFTIIEEWRHIWKKNCFLPDSHKCILKYRYKSILQNHRVIIIIVMIIYI